MRNGIKAFEALTRSRGGRGLRIPQNTGIRGRRFKVSAGVREATVGVLGCLSWKNEAMEKGGGFVGGYHGY